MALTPSESVDLLENLVSIPSPSGQEAEASGRLVEWMAAHGLDAHVDEVGNAVGTRGDGPSRIMLLGHIDTFPGELPVRRQGDWLYGRGTVDAKGPLCAFAAAAAAIDVLPGWQVTVVGAVEEEAASSRGARHLITAGPPPDVCIIGEPSGWDRVTLGYKGRLLAEVRLRAPFAHSAGQSRLPAEQAVDLWNAVVAHCDTFNTGRDKAFERLDPSLRHIVTRDEGAYGTAQMSLGFRLPPGLSPDALVNDLYRLLAPGSQPPQPLQPPQPPNPGGRQRSDQAFPPRLGGWGGPFGGAEGSPLKNLPVKAAPTPQQQVHLAFSGAELAFRADKNTSLVRAFLAAIRDQGGRARFVLKTGTSDMNVVGPAWRCPILAFGPGESALDHTPDERISLSEYLRSIEILKSVLQMLMKNMQYEIRSTKYAVRNRSLPHDT